MAALIALLPALCPALAAAVVLLCAARGGRAPAGRRGMPELTSALSVAGLVGSLVCTGRLWRWLGPTGGEGYGTLRLFDGDLVLDRFGLAIGAIIALAALVAVLAVTDSIARRRLALGECQALILFATAGAVLMVFAGDLLTMFLGLEVMSLAAYALTAMHRTSARGPEGAVKYFLLGAFASGFLLYGIACAYGATGTLQVAPLAHEVAGAGAGLARLSVTLLLVGLAFKVGAVPFHQWVPDAYDGAPAAVTGFMATVIKAAAFAALVRVVYGAGRNADVAAVLEWLAILTMVAGNVMALGQRLLKRLLAYSSVAHAGYALMAVAALANGGGTDSVSALTVYLLTYAVSSLGAFAIVAVLERTDGAPLEIVDCRGLAVRRPVLAAVLTLCLLSLAGLPPLAGFFGKYLVFLAAVRADLVPLAIVGIAASLVGLVYYVRVPLMCYAAVRDGGAPEGVAAQAEPAGGWMRMAIGLAAAGTVWLGVGPSLRPVLPGVTDVLRWAGDAAMVLFAT